MTDIDRRSVAPHPLVHLGAISYQDLAPGMKLLIVGYGQTPRAEPLTVGHIFTDGDGTEWVRATSGKVRSLFEMGINSTHLEGRNDQYATFRNDPSTRKTVARWLAYQGIGAVNSARLIIASYPEDFATHAVVRNGEIVAEFK